MNEHKHARDLAELGFLKQYLSKAGLESELLEPSSDIPIGALLAPLPQDERGRDRYLTFSFVPLSEEELEHVRLLQLYSVVPVRWKEAARANVEKLVLAVNNHLAIGHFSLKEDNELVYRYVWTVPSARMLPEEETLATIDLFVMMLEMFAGELDRVAAGETDVKTALAALSADEA